MAAIATLDFKSFDPLLGVFQLPQNQSFFACSHGNPADSDLPVWFGMHDTAMKYGVQSNKWLCHPKKQGVRLLDQRIIKYMLMEAFLDNESEIKLLNKAGELYSCIEAFMLSLGLMSRQSRKSVQSVQSIPNRQDPFAAFGYRHKNGHDEAKAVKLMKAILYPYIEGYIAPEMSMLSDEICIFCPRETGIECTVYTPETLLLPVKLESGFKYKDGAQFQPVSPESTNGSSVAASTVTGQLSRSSSLASQRSSLNVPLSPVAQNNGLNLSAFRSIRTKQDAQARKMLSNIGYLAPKEIFDTEFNELELNILGMLRNHVMKQVIQ